MKQYILERHNHYVDAEFTPVDTEKKIDLYGTIDVSEVFFEIVDHTNYVIYQVMKYTEYVNNRDFKHDEPVKHPYGYYVGNESRTFF